MAPKISLILPVYNQGSSLERICAQYTSRLDELGVSWELLLIVNGSRDESWTKARQLAAADPHVKAHQLELGGWGRAVKFGIAQAAGELICYTNSARTTIEDMLLILTYALANDKVVLKTTRVIRESFVRRIGSILYNYENRRLIGTPLWDVNGTPKVFPAACIKNMDIHSEGDLIDAEIMAKVYRRGYKIVEVLIVSTGRMGGKSTTSFKSAWKMYTGLPGIRKYL